MRTAADKQFVLRYSAAAGDLTIMLKKNGPSFTKARIEKKHGGPFTVGQYQDVKLRGLIHKCRQARLLGHPVAANSGLYSNNDFSPTSPSPQETKLVAEESKMLQMTIDEIKQLFPRVVNFVQANPGQAGFERLPRIQQRGNVHIGRLRQLLAEPVSAEKVRSLQKERSDTGQTLQALRQLAALAERRTKENAGNMSNAYSAAD
jgi:hypothetical protein